MDNLKPCPFCGSKAEVYVDERGISIKCTCCFVETEPDRDVIKTFKDKMYWGGGWSAFNSAVKKWNKRDYGVLNKMRDEVDKLIDNTSGHEYILAIEECLEIIDKYRGE